MIDPTTASAVITGLVSTLSAYMTYRVGMKNAEQQSASAPKKPDEATLKQGETALAVVEDVVANRGTPDEQTALEGFQKNPQMFRPVFEQALTQLAIRDPEALRQFQTVAQQANVQGSGVNISGGTVYGSVIGQNTGTQTNTYTFGSQDKK